MDFNLHASPSPVVSPPAYVWASPTPTRRTEMEQRRLDKTEDIEEEIELENDLENLTISNSEKYERDYDDSSSEEDIDEIEDDGLEQLNLGTTESIKHIKASLGKRVASLDLQLSFLLHEFGVRLLRLPEVENEYRRLKLEVLKRTNVPSDEQIENYIREAIRNAFSKTYDNSALRREFLQQNENEIKQIIDRALEDKRSFIKAVNKRLISPIIPQHETYFNALPPDRRSEISIEGFYMHVYEVYREIGEKLQTESERASILYSKEVKEKLDAYINVCKCPIKKTIAKLLLKADGAKQVRNFVKDKDNSKILKNAKPKKSASFIHNFQTELTMFLYERPIERETLPDSYTIALNEDYTPAQFLAWLRLMNTSAMREFKNSLNFPSVFGATQKTLSRRLGFSGVREKEMVLETQKIFKETGTRLDEVQDINAYKNIYNRIKKIKSEFSKNGISITDRKIADWIESTLKGNLSDIFSDLHIEESQKPELRTILNAMTYLLFGTEVVRNPANLLIHAMMLELIQNEGLTWAKALEGKMSEMPMSFKGAVEASRWTQLQFYKHTKLPYVYDKAKILYEPNINGNKREKKLFKHIIRLIGLEAKIFIKWLKLQEINIDDSNDLELPNRITNRESYLLQIINRLDDLTVKWYGVSILSKGLIKDIISTRSREIADNLDLDYFSKEDLLDLSEMLQDRLKKRILRLLRKGVQLEDMIEVYNDCPEKFRDLTKKAVISVLGGRLSHDWTDLSDMYDGALEEFQEYVYGEESEEDEESQEDSDEEDSEEYESDESIYFCPSIRYNNPLLNDPHFLELVSVAKKHFGNRGVSKLIGMGTSLEKCKAFIKEELTDALIAKADLEMRRTRNEDTTDVGIQKMNAQLRHYQETGQLFETARRALNEEPAPSSEVIAPLPSLDSNNSSFENLGNRTHDSNATVLTNEVDINIDNLNLLLILSTEKLSQPQVSVATI